MISVPSVVKIFSGSSLVLMLDSDRTRTTNTSYAPRCVRTATLVEPRVTLPPSLKRTKILFVAGLKATFPVPATKIPKVGVAPALIVVVTLLAGGTKQAPVVEFV